MFNKNILKLNMHSLTLYVVFLIWFITNYLVTLFSHKNNNIVSIINHSKYLPKFLIVLKS